MRRPDRCPVCNGTDVQPFFEATAVPACCHVLWTTAEAARAVPRADIRLAWCAACTHVFNLTFDAARVPYDLAYDNALHFSPSFAAWATQLAGRLIEQYDLRGKQIVEIGCGDGHWLDLLCRLGANRGVGYDPSSGAGTTPANLTLLRADYHQAPSTPADLACARHVLEHVEDPLALLGWMRGAIEGRAGGCAYIEVPNVLPMLRDAGLWDVIYEHFSYFGPASLKAALQRSGLFPLRLAEELGGQYLAADASASTSADVTAAGPTYAQISDFAERARRRVANAEAAMGGYRRVAVWGAGSKTIMLLHHLRERERICFLIDVNPRKQGKYASGTGHAIGAPGRLREDPPDAVAVMNPIYREEIANSLRSLGVDLPVITL